MSVVDDGGTMFTAYGARPRINERVPAVVLLHDWWGLSAAIRMLATQLAQAGFYVVAPDLFDGKLPTNAREAAAQVEEIAKKRRFRRVIEAFDVLETHDHANGHVAVAGVGLGGGLAFRAAIQYPHREAAAVAFSGFPQTYMGQFRECPVPIMAVFGANDHLIPRTMVERLRGEFSVSALRDKHQIVMIDGAQHDLFPDDPTDAQRANGALALSYGIDFLNFHLKTKRA